MKRYHEVVIVGGGWAGVSAAIAARKAGCDAAICERTDMLLGAGLVGGIMRNNGRFTAAEEAIAMGSGDLFQLLDNISRHRNVSFPGHSHASLYDVFLVEPRSVTVVSGRGSCVFRQEDYAPRQGREPHFRSHVRRRGCLYRSRLRRRHRIFGPSGALPPLRQRVRSVRPEMPAFGPRASLTSLMGIQSICPPAGEEPTAPCPAPARYTRRRFRRPFERNLTGRESR